jgi:hypothetical protein
VSNALAIAGVSAILQSMLQVRLSDPALAATLGGNVTVSVLPPDRVDLGNANDPNQVNLFLHQVVRNPGWANVDLPSRAGDGQRIAAPPLVLDLHYLLTVFGSSQLYGEILLGECMQALHEQPVPSRSTIEAALSPAAPPPGFPAALSGCGLAEQIERLRIAPSTISAEDVSRLWSAMQARYRCTVAYQVTTVIIESRAAGRRALPVGRRLGVAEAAAAPRLLSVEHADGPLVPVVEGSPLRLRGRDLLAADRRLELGSIDVSALITSELADQITFTLPAPLPAGLRCGLLGLRLLHRRPLGDPPVAHAAAESNVLPLLLRPTLAPPVGFVQTASEVIDGVTLRSGRVVMAFAAPVARHQRVLLMLNRRDAPAGGDASVVLAASDGLGLAPAVTETFSVEVAVRRVPAGSWLVRASVDGADSLLDIDPVTGRYAAPELVL